jgi:hypothetical protein
LLVYRMALATCVMLGSCHLPTDGVRNPEAQSRIPAAMNGGFQPRGAEMDLARMLGDLAAGPRP